MTRPRCCDTELGQWLTSVGGSFHESLYFEELEGEGRAVVTDAALEPGTTAVSCPYDAAVTPSLAKAVLVPAVLPADREYSDRQLTAVYLALHLVALEDGDQALPSGLPQSALKHRAYVASLPAPDSLRTPLYWNEDELSLLISTNLLLATESRRQEWREEFDVVAAASQEALTSVTWGRFLYCCTMLSSRAFPSTLVSEQDSSRALTAPETRDQSATPILLPGVDTLNHAYRARVTWLMDPPCVRMQLNDATPAGVSVKNNYGPKSNEEFIAGYGFAITDNPHSFVALKLSVPEGVPERTRSMVLNAPRDTEEDSRGRDASDEDASVHLIKRDGRLPSALLRQMRALLAQQEELEDNDGSLDFLSWENELDVLTMLEDMLVVKLERTRKGSVALEDPPEVVRPDVLAMIREYRKEQESILGAALQHRETLLTATLERARAAGVDIEMEDEEEAYSEDDESE